MNATLRELRHRRLQIRLNADDLNLIGRGALARGQNRADFILEAALRAAEEALLDRTRFAVSTAAYNEFLARLEAPPVPNARLRKTMRKPAW